VPARCTALDARQSLEHRAHCPPGVSLGRDLGILWHGRLLPRAIPRRHISLAAQPLRGAPRRRVGRLRSLRGLVVREIGRFGTWVAGSGQSVVQLFDIVGGNSA
jgi:hypothetical protein